MNQLVTEAIVLSRTDYGEADRILTLLTPDQGKLSLIAKGVRRVKSKLAGGIELFSVSHITFVKGRGEVGMLISTRLIKHYGHIVEDLDRTMLGYELIKQMNRVTEDEPGPEYFHLLRQALEALDDKELPLDLTQLWFSAQLLSLGGHAPNLQTDNRDQKLEPEQSYNFDLERMAFAQSSEAGSFGADHIKFLRLAFDRHTVQALAKIGGLQQLLKPLTPLVLTMLRLHLRV